MSLPRASPSLWTSSARFTPQHTSTMPDFEVGAAQNETGNEHWVARLFPPTYSEVGSSDEMKTILGNRLTAVDPEVLRNVFHRVHALLTQQKEIVDGPSERKLEAPSVAPSAHQPAGREPTPDDSCIWDEAEISVLRAAYKSTHDENRKLKSHLKFAEQRLASLDSKYTKTRQAYEESTRLLNEARQANSRMKIMADTLKKDLKDSQSENDDLKTELKSLNLERLDLIDKLKNSRISSDHDRIEKKKLELEMRENGRVLLETASHLEAKLKVKYTTEINDLNIVIEELREELSEEKRLHAAARKGLDHLRTHFASLPLEQNVRDPLANLKSY